jgi:hypothetical protein
MKTRVVLRVTVCPRVVRFAPATGMSAKGQGDIQARPDLI